jgi:hypothetical protein
MHLTSLLNERENVKYISFVSVWFPSPESGSEQKYTDLKYPDSLEKYYLWYHGSAESAGVLDRAVAGLEDRLHSEIDILRTVENYTVPKIYLA